MHTGVNLGSLPSVRHGPSDSPQPQSPRTVRIAFTAASPAAGLKEPKEPRPVVAFDIPLQPVLPAIQTSRTTTEPPSEDKSCRFTIRHGSVCGTEPGFTVFRKRYSLKGTSIVHLTSQLEKLLKKCAVPLAIIDGDRLANLADQYSEKGTSPTQQELLSVIENREKGREFLGDKGSKLAATLIQTAWRRYRDRADYLQYRQLKWAVRVISNFWYKNTQMIKIIQRVGLTQATLLDNFKRRAQVFSKRWTHIQKSRRVVVHVPSLGFHGKIRKRCPQFGKLQNTQMARLCEISDPNVDVIYVSPVPLTEEVLHYYNRLLGLLPAVVSGQAEDQCDMSDRYKVLVPEAISTLKNDNMSLSTLLKYSPYTLRRISSLIRGREAYMVTGVPNKDDLAVADALDVPILCPEPHVVSRYGTKSGSKEIFQAAGVSVPPGMFGVCSLQQLYEGVSRLVIGNLHIRRWLLKMNEEFNGQGIAYCDVTDHLECFPWVETEASRYGKQWTQAWAHEAAFKNIMEEVPYILMMFTVVPETYKDWDQFVCEYISQGGVIEAFPAADDFNSLTANFLLEPSGQMELLMVGDQIHSDTAFRRWGLSVPQSSVEPVVLNNMCRRVARACKVRGIVGYVRIDFVTFTDPLTLEQLVWALDLHLGYSDSLALFRLTGYLTLGRFCIKEHMYTIPGRHAVIAQPQIAGHQEPPEKEEEARHCVMSTRPEHSNLALLQYTVFFQLCRAHGIGYDIKERQGTLFTLIDSVHREQVGMITIGKCLQGTLATFARHLSTIHDEVSTPNMQGSSNFWGAVEDIEDILRTVIQNAEMVKEEQERTRQEEEEEQSENHFMN